MIPLIPTGDHTLASLINASPVVTFLNRMVSSWVAHHQRLADLGLSGGDL